jgi:subtilisin family serine protease/subtilisin-like proprotein convertase family protein
MTNRYVCIPALVLAVLTGFLPLAAQDAPKAWRPAKGFDAKLGPRAKAAAESKASYHAVVELREIPGAAGVQTLEAQGITLLESIEGPLYLASIRGASPAGEQMAASRLALPGVFPSVVGVSELGIDWKMTRAMIGGDYPDWARVNDRDTAVELIVRYHLDVPVAEAETGARVYATRVTSYPLLHSLRVTVNPELALLLASQDWVKQIEPIPGPRERHQTLGASNQVGAQLMRVPAVQAADNPLVLGRGVYVGLWDLGTAFAHRELEGRLTVIGTQVDDFHATHVAGTVGATGLDPAARGIAPVSRLFSYNIFDTDNEAADHLRGYDEQGLDVANNSWGFVVSDAQGNCNSFGTYNSLTRDFDTVLSLSRLNIVFSNGNNRGAGDCNMIPRAGFFTTGILASSKNAISVGAASRDTAVSTFSSFGPTRDGRLKPDISSLGVSVRSLDVGNRYLSLSGTSMSAPMVTGVVALMVERYKAVNFFARPTSSLMKAILINTAQDQGNPGPDYVYGYGFPDAPAAIAAIEQNRYWAADLRNREVRTFPVRVPAAAGALRVAIAWTDPAPALLNVAPQMLVNDLDLVLVSPSGRRVLPLTLDPARPAADAVPAANKRDNVEQVVVENPEPGEWTAEITAASVPLGAQNVSLTWAFGPSFAGPSSLGPCTLTATPAGWLAPATPNTVEFAVTSANRCPSWQARSLAPWLELVPSTPQSGSGVIKARFGGNTEGPRSGLALLGTSSLVVQQNAPCRPATTVIGQTLTGDVTRNDCLSNSARLNSRPVTVRLGQGQVVQFELSADGPVGLELYDPQNRLITATGPNASALRLNFATGLTGNHTLAILSNGFRTLNYTLAVRNAGGTPVGTFAPLEISGCPGELRGELTADDSRLGRRGDLFRTKFLYFPGRIGQQVTVDVAEATFDTVLYLISPTGRQIAFNDDFEGSTRSRITAELNETGRWEVQLAGYAPESLGTFRATFNGCTAR